MPPDEPKAALPPMVLSALTQLRIEAKHANIDMTDVIGVSPNQALMWKMSDEGQRLRRILDNRIPGWDDEL